MNILFEVKSNEYEIDDTEDDHEKTRKRKNVDVHLDRFDLIFIWTNGFGHGLKSWKKIWKDEAEWQEKTSWVYLSKQPREFKVSVN